MKTFDDLPMRRLPERNPREVKSRRIRFWASFARHCTDALLAGTLREEEKAGWPLPLRLWWRLAGLRGLHAHAKRWATWDLLLARRSNPMQRLGLLSQLQERDARRLERRDKLVSAINAELDKINKKRNI